MEVGAVYGPSGRPIIALWRTRKAPMTDSTTTGDAIFAASSIRAARAREISPVLAVSRAVRGRYVTSRRDRTAPSGRQIIQLSLASGQLPRLPENNR